MRVIAAERRWPLYAGLVSLWLSTTALADGLIVDKVYDPYVQPLEKEIELRSLAQYDNVLLDVQRHSLGFGGAIGERWFAELYAVAVKTQGESLHIDTYEIELKRQLTEQGEFAFDWGLLFELEHEADVNVSEFTTSLLVAREIGKWTATANFDLIYEWGEPVKNEFETALHTQVRRRWKESFEPGLEIHVGQDTLAVGPVVAGVGRLGGGSKLRWELGYFAGIDEITPDHTVRLSLEYEFL
jgi:hypothetical protein